MRIHIVTAEHFSVPGLILKAFATAEAANMEAAELVRIMRNDSPMERAPLSPTSENWPELLEALQDYHGAAHCYVEITETALDGGASKPCALHYVNAGDEVNNADLAVWAESPAAAVDLWRAYYDAETGAEPERIWQLTEYQPHEPGALAWNERGGAELVESEG